MTIRKDTALYKALKYIKVVFEDILFLNKTFFKQGLIKTFYSYKFRVSRRNAKADLNKMLPLIEKQVTPILKNYIGKCTDFNECPITENVFVFWWDGFHDAPEIVQECLASVKRAFNQCNIICISKSNYELFTDINSSILADFIKGKISVQMFSDILRFNLLKNNGGIWIDATIYFIERFNLLEGLKEKSIESLCYKMSGEFLNYKGTNCTWSGFFIASRKNSVFVQAMDTIFREYYLKYKTYPIYFFIDAVLMVCKLNGIDDRALDKIQTSDGDMYSLLPCLNYEYDENEYQKMSKIPQKLAWNIKEKKTDYLSYYNVILGERKAD